MASTKQFMTDDQVQKARTAPAIFSVKDGKPPQIADTGPLSIILRSDPEEDGVALLEHLRSAHPKEFHQVIFKPSQPLSAIDVYEYFDHKDASIHGFSMLQWLLNEISEMNKRRVASVRRIADFWKECNLELFHQQETITKALLRYCGLDHLNEEMLEDIATYLQQSKYVSGTKEGSFAGHEAATAVSSTLLNSPANFFGWVSDRPHYGHAGVIAPGMLCSSSNELQLSITKKLSKGNRNTPKICSQHRAEKSDASTSNASKERVLRVHHSPTSLKMASGSPSATYYAQHSFPWSAPGTAPYGIPVIPTQAGPYADCTAYPAHMSSYSPYNHAIGGIQASLLPSFHCSSETASKVPWLSSAPASPNAITYEEQGNALYSLQPFTMFHGWAIPQSSQKPATSSFYRRRNSTQGLYHSERGHRRPSLSTPFSYNRRSSHGATKRLSQGGKWRPPKKTFTDDARLLGGSAYRPKNHSGRGSTCDETNSTSSQDTTTKTSNLWVNGEKRRPDHAGSTESEIMPQIFRTANDNKNQPETPENQTQTVDNSLHPTPDSLSNDEDAKTMSDNSQGRPSYGDCKSPAYCVEDPENAITARALESIRIVPKHPPKILNGEILEDVEVPQDFAFNRSFRSQKHEVDTMRDRLSIRSGLPQSWNEGQQYSSISEAPTQAYLGSRPILEHDFTCLHTSMNRETDQVAMEYLMESAQGHKKTVRKIAFASKKPYLLSFFHDAVAAQSALSKISAAIESQKLPVRVRFAQQGRGPSSGIPTTHESWRESKVIPVPHNASRKTSSVACRPTSRTDRRKKIQQVTTTVKDNDQEASHDERAGAGVNLSNIHQEKEGPLPQIEQGHLSAQHVVKSHELLALPAKEKPKHEIACDRAYMAAQSARPAHNNNANDDEKLHQVAATTNSKPRGSDANKALFSTNQQKEVSSNNIVAQKSIVPAQHPDSTMEPSAIKEILPGTAPTSAIITAIAESNRFPHTHLSTSQFPTLAEASKIKQTRARSRTGEHQAVLSLTHPSTAKDKIKNDTCHGTSPPAGHGTHHILDRAAGQSRPGDSTDVILPLACTTKPADIHNTSDCISEISQLAHNLDRNVCKTLYEMKELSLTTSSRKEESSEKVQSSECHNIEFPRNVIENLDPPVTPRSETLSEITQEVVTGAKQPHEERRFESSPSTSPKQEQWNCNNRATEPIVTHRRKQKRPQTQIQKPDRRLQHTPHASNLEIQERAIPASCDIHSYLKIAGHILNQTKEETHEEKELCKSSSMQHPQYLRTPSENPSVRSSGETKVTSPRQKIQPKPGKGKGKRSKAKRNASKSDIELRFANDAANFEEYPRHLSESSYSMKNPGISESIFSGNSESECASSFGIICQDQSSFPQSQALETSQLSLHEDGAAQQGSIQLKFPDPHVQSETSLTLERRDSSGVLEPFPAQECCDGFKFGNLDAHNTTGNVNLNCLSNGQYNENCDMKKHASQPIPQHNQGVSIDRTNFRTVDSVPDPFAVSCHSLKDEPGEAPHARGWAEVARVGQSGQHSSENDPLSKTSLKETAHRVIERGPKERERENRDARKIWQLPLGGKVWGKLSKSPERISQHK